MKPIVAAFRHFNSRYFNIMETCKVPPRLRDIGFFQVTNIISNLSWSTRDIVISRHKMYHHHDNKTFRRKQLSTIELYVRFQVWFLDFWKWFSRESTILLWFVDWMVSSIDQNLQHFIGNLDVSIWVNNSRVGRKTLIKQTNKYFLLLLR